MSTEPMLGVGSTIGPYRIDALLGRGGMGVVYRAEDQRLGRNVAVKVLASALAGERTYRERFLRESRLAASIEHAGILPVYEAGEASGQLYIAMRFVDGVDLARLVRREGPLDPHRAVALVSDLAGALDAAHARGLIHRDVKPSNALVGTDADGEHAYLVDFGVTQDTTARERLTATDQVVGTAGYLAPERIRGDPSDGRADLYALGCVLFECLTGEAPFEGSSEAALLYRHLEEQPRRPSEVRPGLPRALDAVVTRALAKDPAARWQSGSALRDAAREALASAPAAAPALPRRAMRPVGAGLVLLVAGAAAAALVARGNGGEQPQATSRMRALPSEFCSPLQHAAGTAPRLLVVSEHPLSGPFPEGGSEMAAAVEHVLRTSDFKAGAHDLAYQACDEWTDEDPGGCASNARAFAANRSVVGVIGPMISECARTQIPVMNRVRPGPIAMVSPSNTRVGLTRSGAGAEPGEPDVYYPTEVRNYVRLLPAEDLQSAAHAVLARRLGARRAFVLVEGAIVGPGQGFKAAAPRVGLDVTGAASWDPAADNFRDLARAARASRAHVVFVAGSMTGNGARLIRDLRATLRPDTRIMASDGFAVPAELERLGRAAEGMTVSVPGLPPEALRGEAKRFASELETSLGKRPDQYSLYAAQAAQLLLGAIARSDGTRESVVRELFDTRSRGRVLGDFAVTDTGDTTATQVTMYRVSAGRMRVDQVVTPPVSLVVRGR